MSRATRATCRASFCPCPLRATYRSEGIESRSSRSMTLPTGTRLGPYEISSPLGAGGMGEVYRARDSRLGREIAVKVLPGDVASDSASRPRFEQEARSASALNHPSLAADAPRVRRTGRHRRLQSVS